MLWATLQTRLFLMFFLPHLDETFSLLLKNENSNGIVQHVTKV